MRILFIGDIVGKPGLTIVKKAVPWLKAKFQLQAVIANAENVADGSGITVKNHRQLMEAGVDLITLGDHIYKKREIIPILKECRTICRPANYPSAAPGYEYAVATLADQSLLVAICLIGRTYMRPVECPYAAADRILADLAGKAKYIVVDMHAEATADKYLMLHHLKGRVSAVLGTHTHVTTADEQVVPEGTAFICDVGMTGPYDSILGRRVDRVLSTAISFVPSPFDVAKDDVRLAGVVVDLDDQTGKATSIQRVQVAEKDIS